ncbi:hypothetical protein SCLCIDRAFT_369285 [Scleroderma citrinum Foug A]|uniref:Uncharacterized protein n=1 Tax=Scleroderma citrinum Foug A TaxID=1036808 RepID=A0A0C3EDB2_9AGAM|nr:hypothetical protein SCLCIDRAFT_369285 [Scleroderma citrinum Foug A]
MIMRHWPVHGRKLWCLTGLQEQWLRIQCVDWRAVRPVHDQRSGFMAMRQMQYMRTASAYKNKTSMKPQTVISASQSHRHV